MGGFISFIWMGSCCRHLPRRGVRWAGGGGAPGCPPRPTRAPAPRCSRPGWLPSACPGARRGRQAGGSPGPRCGRAAGSPGPRSIVWCGRRAPGRTQLAGAQGEEPPVPARPERGGRGPRGDRARARPAARRTGREHSAGGGERRRPGEASGGLNASRVRLIIKLIKGSI